MSPAVEFIGQIVKGFVIETGSIGIETDLARGIERVRGPATERGMWRSQESVRESVRGIAIEIEIGIVTGTETGTGTETETKATGTDIEIEIERGIEIAIETAIETAEAEAQGTETIDGRETGTETETEIEIEIETAAMLARSGRGSSRSIGMFLGDEGCIRIASPL
jgi:hypothetical protein